MLFLIFCIFLAKAIEEYGQCIDQSKAQSPIQIKPPFSHIELNLQFDFIEARDIQMKHTGEELKVQGAFGFVKHNGKVFNAYEIKFKSPSEHSVSENDYFYPLEMQIFLISQQKYRIGFIVLFKLHRDHQENSLLSQFGFGKNIIKDLTPGDIYVVPEPIHLGELFESTDNFIVYQGSDTFPPCGQMVWLTLFKFYTLSQNQAIDFPDILLYKVRNQQVMKRPTYANFDPALFVIIDGDVNTKQELKTQRERHQIDKKLVKDNFQIIASEFELDGFVYMPSGQPGGKVVRTEDYFVIKIKPEAKDPQSVGEEDNHQTIETENNEEIIEENSIAEEEIINDNEGKEINAENEHQNNQENNQEIENNEEKENDQEQNKKVDLHKRIKERQASKADSSIKQFKEKQKNEQQQQQEQEKKEEDDEEIENINYDNWPRLCKVGKQQSPILLNPKTFIKQSMSHPALEYAIIPKQIFMSNDGYQLKLITDSNGFGALKWNGILYQATEINFHTPSEHIIGTEQFKSHCEIQILHRSVDNNLLILVLFLHNTYPTDRNQFLESIGIPSTRSVNYRAVRQGELVQIPKEIRLSELVSYVTDFITYIGSLSMPPCIENVNYIIRRNRIPISTVQLENMKRLIGHQENVRPIQNLNGRNVYMN